MRGGIVKSLPFSLPKQLVFGSTGGGSTPPVVLMLTGSLPNADEGDDYSAFMTISGGVTPYVDPSVLSGALPAGFTLTIVGNRLVVAGPTIGLAGAYSGALQVGDSSGPEQFANNPFSFTINAVDLLVTEGGDYILTEDGKYIRTET